MCIIERTYRKAPQKPPSSVTIEGKNPDTIRVKWRYVAPTLEEEPIKGYKVGIIINITFGNMINILIFIGSCLGI